MAKIRTVVVAALQVLLIRFADGTTGDEASSEDGTGAASMLLSAGSWAPLARVADGARASFRFRPEASEGASGVGGAVRALLIDATGDARVGALYALTLPGGGRASLLRCHRIHWAPPPHHARHSHAPASAAVAVAPAPAGRVAAIHGLPGAPVRHCSVAMYFTLQGPSTERDRAVALHAASGLVRVWADGSLFQWRDPQPFAPAYLQVGVADMTVRLHIDEAQQQQPHYANGNDIWCVLPRSCKCTPGYHGDFCTALCQVGSWGEDCAQRCGACLEDVSGEGVEGGEDACDPATGACPLGCREGFLPPLCIEEVVRLTDAPAVRVLNASALEVTADARRITGKGSPRLAIVQYRPTDGFQGDAVWQALPPLALAAEAENEAVAPARGAEVRGVVAGLRAGTAYAVRVLLLTDEGAWSPRSPLARNSTACTVPDSFDYKVYAYVDPKFNSTIIRWMATGAGAARCGVRAWRLRLRAPSASWEREVDRREPLRGAQLDVPPAPAQLTVQALTPTGPLAPSRPVPVLAGAPELGRVLDPKVEELESRSATLTWYPPSCCPDLPLSYIITIECERLVHCAAERCAQPTRTLRVEAGEDARVALRGLRPDARYRVAVAAEMEGCERPGPEAELVFDTKSAAPEIRLEQVETHHVGSEGFELKWEFPANCSAANGALHGVHYALRPAAGDAVTFRGLASGRRQLFKHLLPATEYLVALRLVTSEDGPAPETTVRVTTLPEGAEEVRVHEAARERVGLRWLPPDGSAFRGVAVTTRAEGAARNESHPAWAEQCARWRSMRCLTLADLLPDTLYHIWVHITTLNNSKIQEQTFHLVTRTTEGTPSEPRELRAEAASATQLSLRWRAPAQRGGVLRNFVLIVHHVRAFARGACCERNRITSVVVAPADADQQDLFEHEVTGLPPASTFRVSLSAVTATAGPAASLIAHTAPLLPPAAAPAPAMKLLPGPHPCLRVRLPPAAAAAFTGPDSAPVRRLFTFLIPPEEERTLWRRVVKPATATTNATANAANVTLPEALLRVLPDEYKNFQEVYEAEGGWVCVGGAAGGGERAGAALLLQYEGASAAAAWRSDPFDLLRCYPAPAAHDSFTCL